MHHVIFHRSHPPYNTAKLYVRLEYFPHKSTLTQQSKYARRLLELPLRPIRAHHPYLQQFLISMGREKPWSQMRTVRLSRSPVYALVAVIHRRPSSMFIINRTQLVSPQRCLRCLSSFGKSGSTKSSRSPWIPQPTFTRDRCRRAPPQLNKQKARRPQSPFMTHHNLRTH